MSVSGNLKDLTLTGLISLNCTENVRARLRLRRQGEEAVVYFDGGQIVHMVWGDRAGEEVIYELLTWEDGSFELERDVPPPAHTVSAPWSRLVLEGIRLLDEHDEHESVSAFTLLPGELSEGFPMLEEAEETVDDDLAAEDSLETASLDVTALTSYLDAADLGESPDEVPDEERDQEADGTQPTATAPTVEPSADPTATEEETTADMTEPKKRSEQLVDVLSRLIGESSEIQGGAVVGTDGLLMSSKLPHGWDGETVGAVAAAVFGLSQRSVDQLDRGEFTRALIQGSNGSLIVTPVDENCIFIAVTVPNVNLGMALAEARQTTQRLAKAMSGE